MKWYEKPEVVEWSVVACIIGVLVLSVVVAKAQVPPTAAEIIDAIQYLQPNEAADVAECALAYTPPLTRISMLASALFEMYGYTGVDTVFVDSWSAAYPDAGASACGWLWTLIDPRDTSHTVTIELDILLAWLTVKGYNENGEGIAAEPAEVR